MSIENPKFESEEENQDAKYDFETIEEYIEGVEIKKLEEGDESYEDAKGILIFTGDYSGEGEIEDIGTLTEEQQKWIDDKVEDSIKQRLEWSAEEKWWLEERWQEKLEKGELTEQIEFGIGEKSVNFYNFGIELSDDKIEEIRKAMFEISQIEEGKLLELAPHVLILSDDYISRDSQEKDDTLYRGMFRGKHIELSRMGIDIEPDLRKSEVFSTIVYALVHEYGHVLDREHRHTGLVENRSSDPGEWESLVGWSGEKIKEGGYIKWKDVKLEDESKAPTEYAKKKPSEDFAESFAYAILHPDRLDSGRRDAMIKLMEFPSHSIEKPEVVVNTKRGADIDLPKSDGESFEYKVVLVKTDRNAGVD